MGVFTGRRKGKAIHKDYRNNSLLNTKWRWKLLSYFAGEFDLKKTTICK